MQDCCAFAMQEILLLFECGSEDLERSFLTLCLCRDCIRRGGGEGGKEVGG